MVGALGEPHLAEQLERSLSRTADRDELHLDVLHCGERRDQVELLEDESERAQPQRGELAVRQVREVAPLEDDVARARAVERGEQLQQGGLAGAARAFERHELARAELEVDAVERPHRRRPALEELCHPPQLVHGRHQSICLSASAGRSRAARSAAAVPAMRPPSTASMKPRTSTSAPIGASSETLEVAVRVAEAPRPNRSLPVVELALSVGPNAPIAAAAVTPRTMPSRPPPMPVASDSPATWRTTMPCVQPSAFSVPSSRMRLPT